MRLLKPSINPNVSENYGKIYEHVRSVNALISPSRCRAGIRVACMSITSKKFVHISDSWRTIMVV